MKITIETQSLMVIKEGRIFVYVLSAVFTAAGLVVIFFPSFFTNNPPLWSGIVAVLAGILVVFLNKSINVKLDKSVDKFSMLKKSLIGKHSEEYSLSQIKEVEIRQMYYQGARTRNSREGESGYYYELSIIMNNNQRILLNPGARNIQRGISFSRPKEQVIGEKIANFLGVPFQERRPPTVGEVFSEIRNVAQQQIEKTSGDKNELK
jgi:hypothetical protein